MLIKLILIKINLIDVVFPQISYEKSLCIIAVPHEVPYKNKIMEK